MVRNRFVAIMAAVVLGIIQPAAVARAQAPQEGIKVHGHWVIDIRNPDGSLASHLDFENALTPTGAQVLSDILSRRYTTGFWAVYLVGGAAGGPCPPAGSVCGLWETGAGTPPTGYSVLTVGESNGAVVLTGSIQASDQGFIKGVETHLLCSAATVGNCRDLSGGGEGSLFTLFFLQDAAQVSPNQLIQVSVTLSFS